MRTVVANGERITLLVTGDLRAEQSHSSSPSSGVIHLLVSVRKVKCPSYDTVLCHTTETLLVVETTKLDHPRFLDKDSLIQVPGMSGKLPRKFGVRPGRAVEPVQHICRAIKTDKQSFLRDPRGHYHILGALIVASHTPSQTRQ